MVTNNKYISSSAYSYAEVLFEMKLPDTVLAEVKELWKQSMPLQEVLSNPTVHQQQKEAVIDRVFPAEIRNFMKVLCRNKKSMLLEEILQAYENRMDEQLGVVRADLFCTVSPNEEQREKMADFVCRKYKANKAYITEHIEQSLLGGFILKVGCDEYDRSLRGSLDRLEERLIRR